MMYNPLQQLREGISRVESGGDYGILGPEIQRKSGIDRAYGKYQVMGSNIPQWTEQALGRRLSPMEFLHSKEAQELVFEDQMRKNLQKYGNLQDAASVWFSGRPLAQAQKASAHDVNMGVGEYVNKALGGGPHEKGEVYAQVTTMPENDAARMAPGQMSMKDFFEGKHETAPRPQVQPPGQPKVYAPQDFFSGDYEMPQAAPTVAPQPVSQPDMNWGPGSAFLRGAASGLTGGMGDLPKATATVRAGYESLFGHPTEDFMTRRQNMIQEYENQRKAYEQENPLESEIVTSLGGAIGTGAPMGAVARGLGAGSKVLGQVMPRVKPALEATGRFMTGQNPFAWGVPSRAVSGAVQGVGTTALTQDLVPEEDRGRYGTGALIGAGGSVLFGALGSPLAKIAKAELNENLVPIAQNANKKFGLNVRAGQIAKDAEINKLDEMLVPQHVHDAQVQKFSDAVAKELELGGKALTDTNIAEKMEKIGQEIGNTVKGRAIQAGSPAYRGLASDVNKIFADVAGRINPGDPEVQVINNFLKGLRTAFASGRLEGEVLQNFIAHNGRIANAFRNTGRAALNGVEHDLREAFLDAFEKAHPGVGPRFREARQIYKKLAAVDTVNAGSESGVINPQMLLRQVRKRGITGALEELADVGKYLPRVLPTGSAAVRSPSGMYRNAATVAAGVSPLLSALGFDQSFGQLASKAVTGELLREFGQSQMLKNPLFNYLKMNYPNLTEEMGRSAGNALLRPPVAFGTGVGGKER